jgi:hypothetical protein
MGQFVMVWSPLVLIIAIFDVMVMVLVTVRLVLISMMAEGRLFACVTAFSSVSPVSTGIVVGSFAAKTVSCTIQSSRLIISSAVSVFLVEFSLREQISFWLYIVYHDLW